MKIGAIGIRTKIIVGDAATWYLVKKYVDRKVDGGIEDVPEELKKYVRVLDSWVDVTEDLESISNKVDKVAGSSLVPDTEIDKLAEYPEFEDLEFSHENLTDKNSEASFQHVDTTVTKETLDAADMVAIKDSVTGEVVLTPKAQFAMTEQEEWITPTLLNGWTGSGVRYMKDEFGFVHIEGEMKGNSATDTLVFTLPSGYRPNQRIYTICSRLDVATPLKITADGNVYITSVGGTWYGFSPIIFEGN